MLSPEFPSGIPVNTVAAGANVIFSVFDKSINECNVVGMLGSGFGVPGIL